MSLIYFVRHGENLANIEHVFSHRVVDYSLTEVGRKQARAVANWLRGRTLNQIYSSPLKRARETAHAIAETTGASVVAVEELREVNVGELDGRSDASSWKTYKHVVALWHQGEWGARFPGGESFAEASSRIQHFLSSVLPRQPGRDIAAVGHGEIFSAVLPRLMGLDDVPVMGTASITVGRVDSSGRLVCDSWGRIDHLRSG